MNFKKFLGELYNLINKPDSNMKITFALQKGNIVDVLVRINDDIIADTSINVGFSSEENKMARIINAINEYYEYC